MGRSILFALFLAFLNYVCAVNNINIYIESAQYRGHYLAGVGTTLTVRNPPLGTQHKWTVDWDAIFLDTGSAIIQTSSILPTSSLSIPSTVAAAPITLIATTPAAPPAPAGPPFLMSYASIGGQTLYQFTNVAKSGCLYNNGLAPVIQEIASCTTTEMRSWWKVYSA